MHSAPKTVRKIFHEKKKAMAYAKMKVYERNICFHFCVNLLVRIVNGFPLPLEDDSPDGPEEWAHRHCVPVGFVLPLMIDCTNDL